MYTQLRPEPTMEPLAAQVSKVTVTDDSPRMFRMLANYDLRAKVVVKANNYRRREERKKKWEP